MQGRRWFDGAIELSEQAHGTADADPPTDSTALEVLQILGGILFRQGEAAAARSAFERAVVAWRLLGRDDLLVGGLPGLGLSLRLLGELEAEVVPVLPGPGGRGARRSPPAAR